MSNFSLSSKASQDVAIMLPKGYINDVGAEQLEQASEGFLDKGLKKLVVNFADVQFINTIGISIFTGMVQKTLEHDSTLCFTNMKKIHLDIFEVVDLIKFVKVFKNEEEALCFLSGKG